MILKIDATASIFFYNAYNSRITYINDPLFAKLNEDTFIYYKNVTRVC